MSQLAQLIARYEGWLVPGSRASRNNNPGNLMYVGQAGATGRDADGFAIFPSSDIGFNALERQMQLDASRGLTLSQFMNKYAPPTSNDTNAYTNFITTELGTDSETRLADILTGSTATDTQANLTIPELFGNTGNGDIPWLLPLLAIGGASLVLWLLYR